MNWYYAIGDQRQGPISESEFEALISAGTITPETLVWKEGMPNWTPLKQVHPPGAPGSGAPAGWVQCAATGRYFPPEEIVYLDGKPYSAEAKAAVLKGVLQTGALPTSEVGRTGPPWEHRKEIGFFSALFQTIKGVMFAPSETFASMKREGGVGGPLGFDVLLSSVGFIFVAVYYLLFVPFTSQVVKSQTSIPMMILSPKAMGILVLLMPAFTVLSAFIASGIFHLSLLLFQGAKQPFEATFRAHCYVMGAVASLQVIPGCGVYIAAVWAVVALCIALAKVHEISTGRAVFAVLLPVGICCVGLIIFYGTLFAYVARTGHF